MTKGVLLINLGTPENADPKSVYRYLKEFLSDPRVIDLPGVVRYVLTRFFIIPFRYKTSAHAYQKIWTQKGSPLLSNSIELKNLLANALGSDYQVEIAMRYGQPSIESVLQKMQDYESITVIPLFPQYSSAATGSAIEETLRVIQKKWNIPKLKFIKDFHDHPDFINAYAQNIQKTLQNKPFDLLIFSYHGLPQRHLVKSGCKTSCNLQDCNSFCYRAQCYKTTSLITKELTLNENQYCVAFQSRLGRTPWVQPYTDVVLSEIREKGLKHVAIVCPSFVSDCLETLEEINIRAREQWQSLGGESFIFIPCLNDHPNWVMALQDLVLTS